MVLIVLIITLILAACGGDITKQESEPVEAMETLLTDDEIAIDEGELIVNIEVSDEAKSEIEKTLDKKGNAGKLPRIYIRGYG